MCDPLLLNFVVSRRLLARTRRKAKKNYEVELLKFIVKTNAWNLIGEEFELTPQAIYRPFLAEASKSKTYHEISEF